jgi:hypothetical protein
MNNRFKVTGLSLILIAVLISGCATVPQPPPDPRMTYGVFSVGVDWYSDCGHLEKSAIKNKLLEVIDDRNAKGLYEAI